MKYLAILLAALTGVLGARPAAAAPAFYGIWSCAQMIDNKVITTDWMREAYNSEGVSVGAEGKAEALKVRMVRKGLYDLVYADGARARIAMQAPWMFIRGTMDHSYVCLRTGP